MPENSGKLTETIAILAQNSSINIDKWITGSSDTTRQVTGIRQNLPLTGATKFVGRETELTQLHQFLQQNQQVVIAAISGMGGVGKTELALQYAIQHQASYTGGICWCGVKSGDVGSQIVEFSRNYLDLNPPQDFSLSAQLDFCWLRWHEGEVLLVLDDVGEYAQVKPYLPKASRFKVLLTSRQSFGSSIKQLSLDVLQPDAALDLLRSLIGDERVKGEISQAKSLCAWLGYLPLGLELVGRYLLRKKDLSLADMWQQLENKRLEEPALKKHKKDDDMTAVHQSVLAAFELSWQELGDDDKQLGCLLSLFASAPIPWELVKLCLPQVDAEELEEIRDDSLLTLHLLQRQAKGVYQMHPLLREFFQHKLTLDQAEDLKRSFCQVMLAVAQEIPQDPTRELITAISPAMPHVAEVAKNLTVYLSDKDLILPFTHLGRFYEGQGFYTQAENLYELCRVTVEKRFATEHPYLATSLSNLGSVYYTQGRYTEAEPVHQKALEMRRKLLREEHIDVADSLNNLALLFTSQGKYADAETFYKQALEMRRKLLGEEHVDFTDSLNNLALLYDAQGLYKEAEPLFLKALQIRQDLLTNEHPRVATSLNNLASCYYSQELYEEAEKLYLQALELSKKILGEEHHDVATRLNNLAQVYACQKKYKQAEPKFIEALKIQKQILGEEHPDIATGINNLASLYEDIGNAIEAEPLYKQALEMRIRLLGETHLYVAISQNNLAKFYYFQNRYTEAEPLYIKAIEIIKPQLKADHRLAAKVQSNFEELQLAMKISSNNL
jgi:tetratricopeptide (TPR) repeat protein